MLRKRAGKADWARAFNDSPQKMRIARGLDAKTN